MWRKFLIYFSLLCFINTAFVPGEKLDETPYNGIEEVEEEYNTLFELVKEKLLGYTDDTPEDEDDDIPDWIKKTGDFYFHPGFEIVFQENINYNKIQIPLLIKSYSSFLEIFSPPPRIA